VSNQRRLKRRVAGVHGVSERKRTKSARQLQRTLGSLSGAVGKMTAAVEQMQDAAQAQLAENANKPPAEAEGVAEVQPRPASSDEG
jgi:hypothetical protein